MMRHCAVVVVVTMVGVGIGTRASAQAPVGPDIRGSIDRAIAQAGEQGKERRLIAGVPRPYFWTGCALIAGGLAAMTYATKDVECPCTYCECVGWETTKTGPLLGGMGAVGAGVAVLYVGHRRAQKSPSVSIDRRGFAVGYQVRF